MRQQADDLLSQRSEAFIRSRNAPDACVTIELKKHRFQLSGYCLKLSSRSGLEVLSPMLFFTESPFAPGVQNDAINRMAGFARLKAQIQSKVLLHKRIGR